MPRSVECCYSRRTSGPGWRYLPLGLVLAAAWLPGVRSQEKAVPSAKRPAATVQPAATEADPEDEKERVAAERFLAVLEKNPRRGTSLDRVYGYHVERGSIDQWIALYRDRIKSNEQDGTAWLLLGLIESQRGQDAAAVAAFQNADKHLPQNAMASFYLGQALTLAGESDAAAKAFERALERKPASTDQLEIFQALGRVYQRQQQGEKALEVWNRLEKMYPNDLRVQEQIAQTLLDEDRPELALPRFEKLVARTTKDLYRQSQYRIQVAEINVRLGKSAAALAEFEKLLGELNPDNWLYRDVRQKIEAVFLRSEDQDGLTKYYNEWLKNHPDDIDAIVRLSRLLAAQERTSESQAWLTKGLKLAPTRRDLRQAIIDQLIFGDKFADAIPHYEALNQQEPGNPDTIREWGRVVLRDRSRPVAERQRAAADIWLRLMRAKPEDPVVASQVADLFRHAGMQDRAIEHYRLAIKLAPDAPQYREYLGEYFHQLKQPAEALATWRQIIAGKNRTAPNLARLAEVLIGFGYVKEGVESLGEAVKLEPQEFDLRMRLARAWQRAERHDDAQKELHVAESLAGGVEESESVLLLQLHSHQSTETLAPEIERLRGEIAKGGTATQLARQWYLLARYEEANHQLPEALSSILQARDRNPQSIPLLAAVARMQEANNQFQQAADTYRKLATVDRRSRTEYLTNVAKLEARLGQSNDALQAGREVLLAAPGNPEAYDFFAQLCFQLGQNDEGLETLRRSLRVNSSNPKVLLQLAAALAERSRIPEAIELYWRAFDQSSELDSRLDVITKLTELHQDTNHLDRLLERLERTRRSDGQQQRIISICVAQVHQTAGDFHRARIELERMLTSDSRDTQLLRQLTKLADLEGDYSIAAKYQMQLNALSPSPEHDHELARLLMMLGEHEQAGELFVRIALEEKDPEKLLKNVDNLLGRQQQEQALPIIERVLQENPRNWDYLYRYGLALSAKKPREAEQQFQQILNLNIPDDELSIAEQVGKKPHRSGQTVSALTAAGDVPEIGRLGTVPLVGQTVQLGGTATSSSFSRIVPRQVAATSSFWTPRDYGEARIAALGWLLKGAMRDNRKAAFVKSVRTRWEQDRRSERAGWDWFYLVSLQHNTSAALDVAKARMALPDPSVQTQLAYLVTLARHAQEVARSSAQQPDRPSNSLIMPHLALSPAELDQLVAAYRTVTQHPDFGPACQRFYGQPLFQLVTVQLTAAGRHAEDDQLFAETVSRFKSADAVLSFIADPIVQQNVDRILQLLDAREKLVLANPAGSQMGQSVTYEALMGMMHQLSATEKLPEIVKILDHYLAASYERTRRGLSNSMNRGAVRTPARSRRVRVRIVGSSPSRQSSSLTLREGPSIDPFAMEMISTARSVFEAAGRTAELVKHLELEAARPGLSLDERLPRELAVVQVLLLDGAQESATTQLIAMSHARPENVELKLTLAQLYQLRGDPKLAMNQLLSIESADPSVVMESELQLLKLCVQTGNQARAKQAANHLLAGPLDPQEIPGMIVFLRQLGMREEATSLEGRISRTGPGGSQGSSRIASLVAKLEASKSEDKSNTAVQIAQTILRTTQPARNATSGNRPGARPAIRTGGPDVVANARQAAIQVLSRSGKLQEMIAQTETQLKNSPNSIQLHRILAEYYGAAGSPAKAEEHLITIAELNQSDPTLRLSLGMQLLAGRNIPRGSTLIASALKQQPELFVSRANEILDVFQRAKRLPELARILEDCDLHAQSMPVYLVQLVNRLLIEEKSMQAASPLLKRAWQLHPQDRATMLAMIRSDLAWKTPELYEFARQAFIPDEDESSATRPWDCFRVYRNDGSGMVTGSIQYLLKAAAEQNKLPALDQELAEAMKRYPSWRGGEAARALLALNQGKKEDAVIVLKELLEREPRNLTSAAAWMIGQELKVLPEAKALAIQYYVHAIETSPTGGNRLQSTPEFALLQILQDPSDKGLAREVLLRAAVHRADYSDWAQEDSESSSVNRYEIANRLKDLGYPIDALSLYSQFVHETPAHLRLQNTSARFANEARAKIESILTNISATEMVAGIKVLVQSPAIFKLNAERPAIDLLLELKAVSPSAPNGPQIASSMIALLGKVRQDAAAFDELSKTLEQLQARRPDDLSVQIMSCLLHLDDPRHPESSLAAATKLDAWLVAHPLPALKNLRELDSQSQATAARYLPLWLAARGCLQQKKLAAHGEHFATRAIEAAKRQADNAYYVAMLSEGGQLAWDAGDKATAEARWTEMLDARMAVNVSAYSPAAWRFLQQTQRNPTGGQIRMIRPTAVRTTDANFRFDVAMGIARFAAEKELHRLSFKAFRLASREAQQNGTAYSTGNVGGRVVTFESTEVTASRATQNHFAVAIDGMYQRWKVSSAPVEEVYEALLNTVAPAENANAVFIFPQPANWLAETPEQESVGLLLIRHAIEIGKVEDLRERLQQRVELSPAEFSARIMLAKLALETRDTATASRELIELNQLMEKNDGRSPSELLSMVALPALEDDELALSTKTLLMRVARETMVAGRAANYDHHSRIYFRLSKLLFDKGEAHQGVNALNQFLRDQSQVYQSFSSPNDRLIRRRGLLRVAAALARANQLEEALLRYGDVANLLPVAGPAKGENPSNDILPLNLLRKLPPISRYRQLRAWTLPDENRKSLRTLDSFRSTDQAPKLFNLKQPASGDQMPAVEETVSSLLLLVQAAQEAQSLDELLVAVKPLCDQELEHARELQALIRIALRQSMETAEDLQSIIEHTSEMLTLSEVPREPQWSRYHVVCAAMHDPVLRPLGQQLCRLLIEHAQNAGLDDMQSHLRFQLATSIAQDSPQAGSVIHTDAGLQWWRAGVEQTAAGITAGQPPSRWISHGRLVANLGGPESQFLYFRYPLEGSFEFSVESLTSSPSMAKVGFAGLFFHTDEDHQHVFVSPPGHSETLHQALNIPRAIDDFNRHTIQVQPGKVRYLLNQSLLYEESNPGLQSPWLTLAADGSKQTVYRNFQFTGQPAIPKQLRLFEGDRLEGWVSSFYQERQPPRRTIGRQSLEDPKLVFVREADPLRYDWAAQDGVIYGRKAAAGATFRQSQSRLYYHRPLEDGDVLTYEFMYTPGELLVHPSLDRIALLLDPQGVRLHWINANDLDDTSPETGPRNATERPEFRRGPPALPLRAGDWNAVRLTVLKGVARFELNDQLIYELPLDTSNGRQFGFYHDRIETGVRVRNVMLTGNWPDTLSPALLADPITAVPAPALIADDQRIRHTLIGPEVYLRDVRRVVEHAATLPANARYDYLRPWVLPSGDCPEFRMIGDFVPHRLPAEGVQPQSENELRSPAYELVAAAKALKRLNELQQEVEKSNASTAEQGQSKLALLVLINIAGEQWQAAESQLQLLHTTRQQLLKVDALAAGGWPEVLAAWKAMEQPALRATGGAILDLAAAQSRLDGALEPWPIIVHRMREEGRLLIKDQNGSQPTPSEKSFTQWVPSAWATAKLRNVGLPQGRWQLTDREVRHLPGSSNDWLYFRSPLTGDFEVHCEISAARSQELQLHYAARFVGLDANLKDVDLGRIGGLMMSPQLGQPLPAPGEFYSYQMVVSEGNITVFVNNEKILERKQTTAVDPWLGIHAPMHSAGRVRNFRITGNPVIPDELDLLNQDRIEDAWRGDYYEHNGMRWREERRELRSPKLNVPPHHVQTLLQYHRPIVEDGEIEYEYLYEPGLTDVHPALDRMVLLLNPEGVNLHWVTDLPYDRNDLPPGNQTTEPQHRRGPRELPLKVSDWNNVRLKLTGNNLSVILNGTEVYQRPLDSLNSRTFGLFHYADQTGVRVRKILYRGQWPKTLPAAIDQELAPP